MHAYLKTLAVAILAAAIPTCQMIGCDMGMANGMMAVWTHGGASLGNACSGTWVTSASQDGIAPTQSLNFLISLIAAVAAAVVLFSPRMEMRPVRLVDANGPPPFCCIRHVTSGGTVLIRRGVEGWEPADTQCSRESPQKPKSQPGGTVP